MEKRRLRNVDFSTFCHAGDAPRLHRLGHLRKQVESNDFRFNEVIIIHQLCNPLDYDNPLFEDCDFPFNIYRIHDMDEVLRDFNIDLNKPQYVSPTDKAHTWKNHVANHLAAVQRSVSDFIVFADSDCWIIRQPSSWVVEGIKILDNNPDVFMVSPNDGEDPRRTLRMSQQMFMVRTEDFRNADFNQPGWDGDVNIPGGPIPEYWGMLEGRIELYCRQVGRCRFVLPSEFRYWHHNKLNEHGYFETDYSRY